MATGDILSVEVLGTTPHNGIAVLLVIEAFTLSAVFASGLGAGNDPTNAKLKLAVTSEGYNTSAVLGTIAREVVGTSVCIMPYGTKAIPGTLSNTLTDGRVLTQANTGATCVVYRSQGASDAAAIAHTFSGTPNGTDVWTEATSGYTVTPTGSPVDRTQDLRIIGGNLYAVVMISDYVYDDDDLAGNGVADIAATILSGLFTDGATPSAAFSGTATNSSTVDYPPVIGKWTDVPPGRLTSGVPVGFGCVHRHAKDGLQVACVRFDVTDGHSHSDSEVVATPQLADGPTSMPDFEEYRPSALGLTQMNQADDVTIRARAYPWVGDADSIVDSGTTTTTSGGFHALIGLCDKTGAYGLPYVYVDSTSTIACSVAPSGTLTDRETVTQATSGATAIVVGAQSAGPVRVCTITGTPDSSNVWTGGTSGVTFTPSATPAAQGNDGTGVGSVTPATAAASPYATLWAAIKGLRDFINTTYSRSNSLNNGTVRLQDGDYAFGRNGTATTMTALSAPVIIERSPTATRVRFRAKEATAQDVRCGNVRIRNVEIAPASADQANYLGSVGSADQYILETDASSPASIVSQSTSTIATYFSSTVEERWIKNYITNGLYTNLSHLGFTLFRGVNSTNFSGGSSFTLNGMNAIVGFWNDVHDVDQMIGMSAAASDVLVMGVRWKSSGGHFFLCGQDCTRFGVRHVLLERTTSSTEQLIQMTQVNLTDVVWSDITMAGQRMGLQDQRGTPATMLRVSFRNCALAYWAWKAGFYVSDARMGSIAVGYGVGFSGLYNDNNVTFPPDFLGLWSKGGTDGSDEGYVHDASLLGDDTGNGDYSPAAGSVLLGMYPPALRTSLYDIRGQTLPSGSNPAAGAYQLTETAVLEVTIDGAPVAEDSTVQLSAGSHTIRLTASGGTVEVSSVLLGGGVGGTVTGLIDTITDGDYREATIDVTASGAITIISDAGDGSFGIAVELMSAGADGAIGDGGGWGQIIGQ